VRRDISWSANGTVIIDLSIQGFDEVDGARSRSTATPSSGLDDTVPPLRVPRKTGSA